MKRQSKESETREKPEKNQRQPKVDWLVVRGARQNNLKEIDVPFALGAFNVVTGVSGSGKSSLVNDILYKTLAKQLHRANVQPGKCNRIEGIQHLNKVIRVDQQPIGQTPSSNPATYTGVFETIRELYAQSPEAMIRGFSPRRFSFNVAGGRCEQCEGAGQIKIEMHFLPDVWITCDSCDGRRYDAQTLEVKFRGYSIADVLEMACKDALDVFENVPAIRRVLKTLCDVGLDYITLGQSAPTLSGGESQRLKLATELSRPDTGRTLYLLDEPTTGLHFDDLLSLLNVLHRLVDWGNTVIVIEHNLDIIKNADWVVDLGPEAGNDGGQLVFAGTPEALVQSVSRPNNSNTSKKSKKTTLVSYTAKALQQVLEEGSYAERIVKPKNQTDTAPTGNNTVHDDTNDLANAHRNESDAKLEQKTTLSTPSTLSTSTKLADYETRMPWELDGPRWHTEIRCTKTGNPIRWDGKILAEVVRKIEESGHFAETHWNNRMKVSIISNEKTNGWFFHSITSDEWLLKMCFRIRANVFHKAKLIRRLDLPPLSQIKGFPIDKREQRVKVHRPAGNWQEISMLVHSWKEINKPAFWDFLDTAIASFGERDVPPPIVAPTDIISDTKKTAAEIMPWKILGAKWHFLDKGLVRGEKRCWDISLLQELFATIKVEIPNARFYWKHKVLVSVMIDKSVRFRVHTKRTDALYVDFFVSEEQAIEYKITKPSELKSKKFKDLLNRIK